jgi:hypothetical protein
MHLRSPSQISTEPPQSSRVQGDGGLGVDATEAPGMGEGDGFQVYAVEFAESVCAVLAEGDHTGRD